MHFLIVYWEGHRYLSTWNEKWRRSWKKGKFGTFRLVIGENLSLLLSLATWAHTGSLTSSHWPAPPGPFPLTAFQPLCPHPVALYRVFVTQVLDLALGLVESHNTVLGPFIQFVQIPIHSLLSGVAGHCYPLDYEVFILLSIPVFQLRRLTFTVKDWTRKALSSSAFSTSLLTIFLPTISHNLGFPEVTVFPIDLQSELGDNRLSIICETRRISGLVHKSLDTEGLG